MKEAVKTPGTKFGLWIGIFVLFIPLVVYIICLCPTVFVGDAGDFLTASYTLGVPHPPGYPTYTMLGNLFMNLPIPGGLSQPAYRMNMLSAIAGWAACMFLFLFLRRILRTEWAALAGALVLAFSGQFWEHAEIAEVYTMQVMFITLIFYLATLWVQERKIGWALLLAFIMGLALTHQYAVLLFYPGVFIYIGVNGGLRLKWTTWVLAVILAIIGLTPYAYLPIVKYKTPLGEVVFASSDEEALMLPPDVVASRETPLEYFLYYASRHFYSMGREYTHDPEVLKNRTTTPMVFRRTVEVTDEDFGVPLIIFGFIGWLALILSLRGRGREPDENRVSIPKMAMLPVALGYILYFLVVHFFPSGDILAAPLENLAVVVPPLLIPLQVSFAAIIALGFDFSLRAIVVYVKAQGAPDLASNTKFRTFAGLLLIAVFSLVAVNGWRNSESGNKSESVISYNYALNILDSCDPDAILLTTGDETFLFWYVQYCEPSDDPDDPYPGYRKDVVAVNWIHNLESLAMLTNESQAMRVVTESFVVNSGYYNIPIGTDFYGDRPINSTFVAGSFAESPLIDSIDVVLNGLTYLLRNPGDFPDLTEPEVRATGDLGPVAEGAESLQVIDYYDARPFNNYRMAGLPRFQTEGENIFSMEVRDYIPVNLEPQEMEVLGRYQDSLYRFGIVALLDRDDPTAREDAVRYFYLCVTLDYRNWFGWKELGDAFMSNGELMKAELAYNELLKICEQPGYVEPSVESGAWSGLAHIALIQASVEPGKLDIAEDYARHAMLLNPDDSLAREILNNVESQRARALEEEAVPSESDETEPEESEIPELAPFDDVSE